MFGKVTLRLVPLVVVVAMFVMVPGVAWGQHWGGTPQVDLGLSRPVACWVSGIHGDGNDGPFEKEMPWASDPSPIVGFFREGIYALKNEMSDYFGFSEPGEGGAVFRDVNALNNVWYYDTISSLADGAFYAPFEQSQKYDYNSVRDPHLKPADADASPWVPGGGSPGTGEYGKYVRSTSKAVSFYDGIVSFGASWQSPGDAAGGGGADEIARMGLANSYAANLLASSQEQMIAGNRVLTEQRQVPVSNPTGTMIFNCAGGGSCNQQFTQQVEIVSVSARADAIDTNNAEYLNTTFERNQRNTTGRDREGQLGHTSVTVEQPNEVDPNLLDPTDPYKGNEPDTSSDRISITIELNDEFRKDFTHDYGLVITQTGDAHLQVEEAVLSRFRNGDQLLRVLDDMRVSSGSVGFVAPSTSPTAPDVNPGNSPILDMSADPYRVGEVGNVVDFGWVDPTVDRISGVAASTGRERMNGMSLGAIVDEAPPLSAEDVKGSVHVGYRTSWLTSSRFGGSGDQSALLYKPWRDASGDHYADEYYDDHEGVLQWPVNFSDMAWYLFEINPTGYTGDLNALMRHEIFGPAVAASGYGSEALELADMLVCEDHIKTSSTPRSGVLEVPECKKPASSVDPGTIVEAKSLDDSESDWRIELQHFRGSTRLDSVFPFETADGMAGAGPGNLRSSWLVMQGVESPEVTVNRGHSTNSMFEFDIVDNAWFGEQSVFSRGREALIQHGFPPEFQDGGSGSAAEIAGIEMMGRYQRDVGVTEKGALDPNQPYLLVLTFYQVRKDSDRGFKLKQRGRWITRMGEDGGLSGHVGQVPGYQVRRVICRAWIYSKVDHHSIAVKETVWQSIKGILGNAAQSLFEALNGMLTSVLQMLYRGQFQLARSASGAVCSGMQVMDSWAVGRNVEDSFRARTEDRAILLDPAVVATKDGLDKCKALQQPDVRLCDLSVWDVAFKGRCRNLPKYELAVTEMQLIDPGMYNPPPGEDARKVKEYHAVYDPSYGAAGVPVANDVTFKAIDLNSGAYNAGVASRRIGQWANRHAAGLVEFKVEWDVVDETIEEGLRQLVNGYVVYILPDPKVMVHGAVLPGYAEYVLPRRVTYKTCAGLGGVDEEYYNTVSRVGELTGFKVGGMGLTERSAGWRDSDCGSEMANHGSVVDGRGVSVVTYAALPRAETATSWDERVQIMPVAPGYQHTFAVAAFHGVPGVPGFRVGPRSDPIHLHGELSACLWLHKIPTLGSVDEAKRRNVIELYGCMAGSVGESEAFTADDAPVYKILSPVGSDLCHDLFTATPAHLTWNNPVVKQLWTLMWVLSGLVLLALLLWQGVRMTYDMWLDPQPSVGLRELVPRLLLAVVLAASSLWLCQVILVLASDLTCFVAQATGTTMWSLVAGTMTSVMEVFFSWENNLSLKGQADLSDVLMSWLKLIVVVFVILVFLVLFIIVFVKVCIAMLIRLVTLAALIVFAPLAFTFYASDATAHWTKLWVRMFLGTTFVQAVVLIVLYMGVNMMTTALSFGGAVDVTVKEKGLSDLIVGILVAFLTFGLADSVPKIVNRDGQGLTDSVRGMGRMAVGGAALAAGTVAGIATGGVGFAAQSGLGMARGARGGWSGGDDSSGSTGGGGGSQRPGGGGPPTSPLGGMNNYGPPASSGGSAPGGSSGPGGANVPPSSGGNIPGSASQPSGLVGPTGQPVSSESLGINQQPEAQQRSFGQRLAGAAAGVGMAAPGVAAAGRGRGWMRGSVDAETGRRSPSVDQRFAHAIDNMPSGPVAGARAGLNRGRSVNRFMQDVERGTILQGRDRSERYGQPVTRDSAARQAIIDERNNETRHEQMMSMMAQVSGGGHQAAPAAPAPPAAGPNYRPGPSGLVVPP